MDVRYTENNLNGRENVTNGKGSNVSGATAIALLIIR
mgnify:CR=1 FL=1